MAVRDLIPWGRNRSSVPSPMTGDPFVTLHREMNRLFDDVFNRFDTTLPALPGRAPGWSGGGWPSLEIDSRENAIRVSAELPGMEEKDIEVLIDGDILTIRGEKRSETSETEDQGRRFSERYYGRFERSVTLPFEVEEDKAEASFKNGVLTVTLPRSATAQERAKRIPIGGKSETTQH